MGRVMPRPRKPYLVELADRVRRRRLALPPPPGRTIVSQEVLAERAGIHRTYVGFIEQGRHDPTIGTVLKLAKALGVDPSELVTGLEPPP
ncbi:MAG: hypothetical protein QOK43_871 [Acidimicrobiaceae bacterium]|jgi:DNA-binding XRE family transcriptional regulator|nr:hypothetical protein [Acidimicrobiaceae bacterium]MDQ1446171.1 hypothetical protein [Acidimicrobiaceae bacterium]